MKQATYAHLNSLLLATYFDMDAFKTKYLVNTVKAVTAEGIYSSVRNTFTEILIPMENIVGYSSDITNMMFGERNLVSQLLKSELKNVQRAKCSWHLIQLASSCATKQLPNNVFWEFQSFFGVEPHKLLSPAQTCWLSLQACVNRILKQYEEFKQYFILVVNEDLTHAIEHIHKSLLNMFTLAYLEFLRYQLEWYNDFNLLFQCERPALHCPKPLIEIHLRSIRSDFMKRDYVKTTNL